MSFLSFKYYDWVDVNISNLSAFAVVISFILIFFFSRHFFEYSKKKVCFKSNVYYISFSLSILYFAVLYAYWTGLKRPSWYGWSDQSFYLRMAEKIHHLSLLPGDYLYGLFYPLLGSFFIKIYPQDPFLIVNFFLYIISAILFFKISSYFLTPLNAALGWILISYSSPLTEHFVVTWTSSMSVVCFLAVIYISLRNDTPNIYESVVIGLCAGVAFATRYVDVVLIIPFYVLWIFRLIKNRLYKNIKEIKKITVSCLIVLVLVVSVFYSHYHYFGSIWKTPYHLHPRPGTEYSDQSIQIYKIINCSAHLFGQFINPILLHFDVEHIAKQLRVPMLARNFLFIFSIIGFIIAFRQRRRVELLITLFFAFFFHLLIYGMHPGSSAGCLQFSSLHYFKALIPIIALFSVYAIQEIGLNIDYKKKLPDGFFLGIAFTLLFVLILFLPASISVPGKIRLSTNKDAYKSGDIIKINVQTMNFWNKITDRRDYYQLEQLEVLLDSHSFEGNYIAKNFSLRKLSRGRYYVEIDYLSLKDAPGWNVKLEGRIFKAIKIEKERDK